MIPINYPEDIVKLQKDYISNLNISDEKRRWIERFFNLQKFSSLNVDLDKVLISDFKTLLVIRNNLSRIELTEKEVSWLKKMFNYDKKGWASYQRKIAKFFFINRDLLNLKTCYFCNIDYINGFNDIGDYHNALDFVKRASKDELIKIDRVTEIRAGKILNERSRINKIDDLSLPGKVKDNLKLMKVRDGHSHFTLDHVLDKGSNPLFALSFHNFVPSCYSCNCKFKGSQDILNGTTLSSLSPTSSDFNLDKLIRFRVLFYNAKSVHTVRKASDFVIDFNGISPDLNNYISMFKLIPRYSFHKDEIVHLINQKKKYSDSKILEMSRQLKLPILELKKDIFGKELFEGNVEDKSLTKFKRDIARNIGISDVKA